jgi:hypothetical protein
MKIAVRQESKCRLGSNCRNKKCPFAHPQGPRSPGAVEPNLQVCRHGPKCSQRDCKNTQADPASYTIPTADSSIVFANNEGQNSANSQNQTVVSLLQNFQDMFGVQTSWIDELAVSLAEPSCKLILIFVDLDNVPRFFEHVTHRMIASMPFETYIVCSANSARHAPWKSVDKVHFSLANFTKDAADAICTMAAAKLDSILVAFGRQQDVPLFIVSDDKIFSQVNADPPAFPGCSAAQLRVRRA